MKNESFYQGYFVAHDDTLLGKKKWAKPKMAFTIKLWSEN